MDRKIDMLKRILDESKYTVALCGSGIMEEAGFVGLKNQNRAYEIEKKYNDSPEEIFTSVYYTTRPEKFFEFYKKELLEGLPGPTESGAALAAMEREGKLQYMITANIYEQGQRAGCHNVINLHGSVYKNKCLHCGREFDGVCQRCKRYSSVRDVRRGDPAGSGAVWRDGGQPSDA